jgi:hypothetical protein
MNKRTKTIMSWAVFIAAVLAILAYFGIKPESEGNKPATKIKTTSYGQSGGMTAGQVNVFVNKAEETIDEKRVLLTLRYAYQYRYPDGRPFKGAVSVTEQADRTRPILNGDVIPINISERKNLTFGVGNGNKATLGNVRLYVHFSSDVTVTKYEDWRKISDQDFNTSLIPLNQNEEDARVLFIEAKPGKYPVECTIKGEGLDSKTINFHIQVY